MPLVIWPVVISSCSKRVPERTTPHPSSTAEPRPSEQALALPARPDAGTGTSFELGPLPADAPFEGKLRIEVVTIQPETTDYARYSFFLKGKKARWDLFGDEGKGETAGYRVYDGEKQEFFTIMRQPVLYATREDILRGDGGSPRSWTVTPFRLEPKATVANLACDQMVTHDREFDYAVCLAPGLPGLPLHLLGPAMARVLPFGPYFRTKGLFPLSVVVRRSRLAPGETIRPVVAKLTVIEAERGRVPERAFELPPYPRTDTATLIPPRLLR
jgi:hypothetical protein